MTKQVYVGNISHDTTAETLRSAFETGDRKVAKVALVTNPRTGRSRGFGFVEMETEEAAADAIRELNGTTLDGRPLQVKEGKERPEFQIRADPDLLRRGGNRRRRR